MRLQPDSAKSSPMRGSIRSPCEGEASCTRLATTRSSSKSATDPRRDVVSIARIRTEEA
jgi:hypothetical protein